MKKGSAVTYINENNSIPGIGLLYSNEPPYNVGKPIRFLSSEQLEHFVHKYSLLGKCVRIKGYNILIVWIGTRDNYFETLPTGDMVTGETLFDLHKMAIYYERKNIKGNETRLKKFKEA